MPAADLSLTIAALFTGAAFYVSFAEQPARLRLEDRSLLVQWKTAYKRGLLMQASLAIAGFLSGGITWWSTRNPFFLVGAVLMLANWPWTLVAMMPTNRVLMATESAESSPDTRALLVKWNRLHIVRICLGFLATLAFLLAQK